MANEAASIKISVVPTLDQRETKNLFKEIKDLEKRLKKVDVGFKKTSKTASQNIQELKQLSKSAESFGSALSSGTQAVYRNLGKLSKKLEAEQKKAAKASSGKESAGSKEEADKFAAEFDAAIQAMSKLNKQVDAVTSSTKKHAASLKKAQSVQDKYVASMGQMASYTKTEAAKGIGAGLEQALSGGSAGLKSGIAGIAGSIGKGVQGALARNIQAKHDTAKAKGDAGGMAAAGGQMQALSGAAASLGAAAAGIAVFIKLLMKASTHMSDLNKAMINGQGFAGDMGAKTGEYTKSLQDMRQAAAGSAGEMLKYGLDSEKSLQVIGAFSKQASGSVIRTGAQLKKLGDGDLQKGLFQMASQAQLYGKALGMEATEVGAMMGDLVSEIGMNSDQVLGTMGDVVKQAAQSNLPLGKFTDIFRQAVPNLDMFSNRIEEVTGMVKLMSKTMDPKALKNFMSAFGKGFDQLDFKQRLKMALVVGPGEMQNIMNKDMKRTETALSKQLPENLQKDFAAAMKGKGSLGDIAAKASMQGADGAVVANIKKLERMKKLSGGGVLKQATGMREMGLMGRMEAMEKYAGKFTGGDITGLGEHVAKQLGVSESEYQAILDMKASMETQMTAVKEYGITGSDSINKSLREIYGKTGVPDKDFESFMKAEAKKNPKGVEENIKIAATKQLSDSQQKADDDKKKAATVEDIGIEQVNATMSIGDKIENVVGVLLEKLYFILHEVLTMIGSVYDYLPNFLTNKSEQESAKKLRGFGATVAAGGDANVTSQKGKDYYANTTKKIASSLESGADTNKLLSSFGADLTGALNKGTDEDKLKVLRNAFSPEDAIKFLDSYKKNDIAATDKLLKDLNPAKAADLLASASYSAATGMTDAGPKEKKSVTGLETARMLADKADSKAGDSSARAKELVAQKEMAAAKTPEEKEKAQKELDSATAARVAAEEAEKKKAEEAKKAAEKTAEPAAPGAGAAGSAPGAAGPAGSTPAVPPAAAKADEATVQMVKKEEDATKIQGTIAEKAEREYQATSDTLGILKKGIKYEQTWLNSKYKRTVAEAVQDGVSQPLIDLGILYAKMWVDEDFRKALAEGGSDARKLGMSDLIGISGTESGTSISQMSKDIAKPADATPLSDGGSVTRTGLALVHAGEDVVPPGKGGGKVVNVSVTMNVQTDASPEQIRDALYDIVNVQ